MTVDDYTADEISDDARAMLRWAGLTWHVGPIPTALRLVEPELARRGGLHVPRLPLIAERGNVEVASIWSRPLNDDERAMRYVLEIDKHASYLGVCSSLELGVGDPIIVDRPKFDRRLPGYWHIAADRVPLGVVLPDPLGRDMHSEPVRWVSTPTVELAIDFDIDIEIRQAWLWPRHARLFRPYYHVMRMARHLLGLVAHDPSRSERAKLAAGEALDALKACYGAFLGGGLASDKNAQKTRVERVREGIWWYRPDWRHAIIAKARANLLRNIVCWHGYRVAAIYNDAAYVLSQEPDGPLPGVRLDASLAGYEVKSVHELAELYWPESRTIEPTLAWRKTPARASVG